jgi:hypothetical protein
VNQFATPGLGSLMGGKFLEGLGQLALSVIGFLLVLGWFFQTMKEYYNLLDSNGPEISYTKYALAGLLFFGAAWFWSLLTSIRMIRDAKDEIPPAAPAPPPRITNIPPKM